MTDRMMEQIGNYRIIRLLDRGGFAHVYLGEHIYLGTQVAIKILNTRLTVDDRNGFLTEARTIAHLMHSHIVRVLDFGIHNGVPFLVMDYAPNGSLRQHYPKGTRLPLYTAVSYVKQIASALEYAHNHKLIHRDIKPENILLGHDDQLLLSDFGIAVVVRNTLSQSMQEVVGTLAYMAPEQVEGKPRPESDQYALAILVYEWLSGERPFHGSLTEIATQQLLANPPSLREKAPDIPPAVEQVIMRALAKDPKQRYSTIGDFAHALEQASHHIQPTVEALSRIAGPPALLVSSGNLTTGEMNSATAREERFKVQSHGQSRGRSSGEDKPVWHIGKRQLLFMITGVLVYTVLSNVVLLIHLQPTGGNEVLWLLPALVIPIFFGVVYGPWVGLLTGGLGYFLGNYTSIVINWHPNAQSTISFLTLASLSLPWYFCLAFFSIGCVAGLALLFTKGRYNSIRALATAEIVSAFSILLAFIGAFNPFWPHLYAYETVWLDFTHIALPNIVLVLILLPIMLMIRHFTNRGRLSSDII
ncbi:MAG: protein kinase [Ktedonobacteraceae bacterium]|nr:protein kinase [Ktedonobacteraceae bacterium]